jgi:hypothetical protein
MKMLKIVPIVIVVLMCISSLSAKAAKSSDNTLSKEQQAAGWQLLFDGKTLDRWSTKSGFATYKVDNAAIVGTTIKGSPNTFLCSDGKYADFELTFEVKYDGEFFNSGVQIRSKLRGDKYGGRVYGPQVEIERAPGQAGFIYGEQAGKWQSPEPKSKDPAINSHSHFKNDQWNQYRVLAVGRRIQTWINGNAVADLIYDEQRYKDNSEGLIGLQVHGIGKKTNPMSIRWKNIYIRPIQDSDQQQDNADWVSLLNDKDLDGWKFHLDGKDAENKGTFTLKDGILYCPGNPKGYMYTTKSYSNYTLEAELLFERPDGFDDSIPYKGNSGVLVHVAEKNALKIWPRCIEVQGMHRDTARILPIPRNLKCQHTDDKEARAKVRKPVGQWNKMRIEVNGKDMLVYLNGTLISTVSDCELTKGQIALQSEGAATRWRNIRIREK